MKFALVAEGKIQGFANSPCFEWGGMTYSNAHCLTKEQMREAGIYLVHTLGTVPGNGETSHHLDSAAMMCWEIPTFVHNPEAEEQARADEVREQIEQIERETMLPRAVRELLLAWPQKQNARAYEHVLEVDRRIAKLREGNKDA